MQSKNILIIAAVVLVVGAFIVANKNAPPISQNAAANVSIAGGQQIIALAAKGGFSPALTTAEAGIPSILRVSTSGTFDCSSALVIPSIGYRSTLPPSGTTDITIPSQTAGTTLNGTCSMGMYNFAIAFE